MNLKICKLHPDAIVPKYQTDGAACFDLHAATVDGFETSSETIQGFTMVIGTGLAFEVPEGWALMIYSRSGHGFKNYTRLVNCVGVIDSDYRGEVFVKLATDDLDDKCGDILTVSPGDRIAQACLVPVPRVTFEVVEQLSLTERGTGGFGSTDKEVAITTPKPPWLDDIEADEADPHLEALVDFAVLLLIVLFACVCAGIVYELAQPWVAEVLTNWEFKP